jgi:hypothetical protein
MVLALGLATLVQAQAQENRGAAHAAEPTGTLALACNGTTTDITPPDAKPEPISMGIMVNFTTRTVQGFGSPGSADIPVNIHGVNDVTITFGGQGSDQFAKTTIGGEIDRVTGDTVATLMLQTHSGRLYGATYSLKCGPAQRMF